ncbi:hypothetical protein [Mollivirus kamchatka]|nr:hypothetical protein [Mollivirus kamchatka]
MMIDDYEVLANEGLYEDQVQDDNDSLEEQGKVGDYMERSFAQMDAIIHRLEQEEQEENDHTKARPGVPAMSPVLFTFALSHHNDLIYDVSLDGARSAMAPISLDPLLSDKLPDLLSDSLALRHDPCFRPSLYLAVVVFHDTLARCLNDEWRQPNARHKAIPDLDAWRSRIVDLACALGRDMSQVPRCSHAISRAASLVLRLLRCLLAVAIAAVRNSAGTEFVTAFVDPFFLAGLGPEVGVAWLCLAASDIFNASHSTAWYRDQQSRQPPHVVEIYRDLISCLSEGFHEINAPADVLEQVQQATDDILPHGWIKRCFGATAAEPSAVMTAMPMLRMYHRGLLKNDHDETDDHEWDLDCVPANFVATCREHVNDIFVDVLCRRLESCEGVHETADAVDMLAMFCLAHGRSRFARSQSRRVLVVLVERLVRSIHSDGIIFCKAFLLRAAPPSLDDDEHQGRRVGTALSSFLANDNGRRVQETLAREEEEEQEEEEDKENLAPPTDTAGRRTRLFGETFAIMQNLVRKRQDQATRKLTLGPGALLGRWAPPFAFPHVADILSLVKRDNPIGHLLYDLAAVSRSWTTTEFESWLADYPLLKASYDAFVAVSRHW